MNSDTLSSYLGIILGALHQVGLVGTVPQSRTDWINTAASAGIVALGYLCNKPAQKA